MQNFDVDNSSKFNELRNKYKEFYYNSYSLSEDKNAIYLKYEFEIPNLTTFEPTIKILKKNMNLKSIRTNYAKNMAFHIGLIELVSYWKSTCSPNVVIKCGFLNEEQKNWWKKIYFYGLGEMFYRNNINTNIQDFMNISCLLSSNLLEYDKISDNSSGYIIPIGGGKDSVVTLETLNDKSKACYIRLC